MRNSRRPAPAADPPPGQGRGRRLGDTTDLLLYSLIFGAALITWGKLGVDTPKFIIESDASIVAPLMFALILEQ